MLRDCGSALILVALTGPFYALGIYLSPSRWSAGYAFVLLVLLSVVLTVASFVFEFRSSRRSRRLRESGTALDDCSQRLDAISREKAMRLNAYVATLAGCTSASRWKQRRIRFDGAGHSVSGSWQLGSGAPRPAACSCRPISAAPDERMC